MKRLLANTTRQAKSHVPRNPSRPPLVNTCPGLPKEHTLASETA
jgi:hypothetical protein